MKMNNDCYATAPRPTFLPTWFTNLVLESVETYTVYGSFDQAVASDMQTTSSLNMALVED